MAPVTQRSVIGFTLFIAATIALLIGLGLWQLQRLTWKEGVIAQIEARTKAAPVALSEVAKRANAGEDVSYTRISADGRFEHDKELYLYAIADGDVGWHVITPLLDRDGTTVLVDRGFVPESKRDPATRAQGELAGEVTVIGLARMPEKQGAFTPDNEVAANSWFWHDLPAMVAALYPQGGAQVVPFYLEAERADVPGGWPRGGQTTLDIPNNHFQYALTWFLMAFCVAAIYAVWLRTRLRGEACDGGND
jgi:surfeit locus 1 family protein